MEKVLRYLNVLISILRGYLWVIRDCGKLKIGIKVKVRKGVELIAQGGTINIGSNVTIRERSYISVGPGEINIGNYTRFNRCFSALAMKNITIGDDCAFGPNVTIYDHDHRFGPEGIQEGFNCSDVVIGNHCWIGANVIILRGTHIGKNCVIGAGCVVKGDVPDNTLVTQGRDLVMKKLEDKNKIS